MKTFLIFSFLLFSYVIHCQTSENMEIKGYYQLVTEPRFYIIDNDKIVRIDLCDYCESTVLINATSYTFIDDTLSFNFGKFYSSGNYYENTWIYLDSMKFINDEFGEYIRINKESLDNKLEKYGVHLIEID